MPRRYRKTKPRFKKRVYRKRKIGPTITALKANVVPDRLIVKLPYFNASSLVASAGIPLDTQFRLNSIYDPEVSVAVGQTQPLGVDQWANFYNRYRVIGVSVKVTARNAGGDAAYVGMVANNDTGNLLTEAAYEQSRTTMKMVGATSGGHDVCVLKKWYNLANLTGRPKSAYISDDRYQAQFDADPAEAIHLHLCTQPVSASVSLNMHYSIRMVYLVELFDRKALAQSS